MKKNRLDGFSPADPRSRPQKGGNFSQQNPRRSSSPALPPSQLIDGIISGNQEKEKRRKSFRL